MINEGLTLFKGKNILLLQGPMGPFFKRLARDLEWAGARVVKVDFCGGDWLFSPANSISFHGRIEVWPEFFSSLIRERKIDVVLLFGDCRPLHRIAHEIAHGKGLGIGVFEEGYVRPDYITLERYGVNGFSLLPRSPIFYLQTPETGIPAAQKVGHTFWYAAGWACLYYLASAILFPLFRHYRHHRSLSLLEAIPWIRSLWRKVFFSMKEQRAFTRLKTSLSREYYLVPLQVHNDAQVKVHSRFDSVEDFIKQVMESFASHAPQKTSLVFKHHPMDRGYYDYNRFIKRYSNLLGIKDRVIYLHDQHLPTLMNHALGVIVANSTVGLSALDHGLLVKACKSAVYDMEGLTFQGELDNYWQAALEKKPNSQLHSRFRNYLIRHTQLNGNFYKRLNIPGSNTGLDWGNRLPDQVARPEGSLMTASSTRPEIPKQRAFK
jgi:capsular polysaccharide export protein